MEYCEGADYAKTDFNPSFRYPEYPFGEEAIRNEDNSPYDMIRKCLIGLGLDKDNYNTAAWNPLGKYMKPGDYVLIKPNWVMHENGAKHIKENALECLVTHPSCLRAICDFCLIALKGEGKIVIGDAPMQDCDLNILLEKARFNEILKFYEEHRQPVSFMDLRQYQSVFDRNKVIVERIDMAGKGFVVDMSENSLHNSRKGQRTYQVDNYSTVETNQYHNGITHKYSVSSNALNADVIINFCKPKSHRLAGFTGAMKNMIGIAYNKASLPHRTKGSIMEGGDAYLHKNRIKQIIDRVLDRKIEHENARRFFLATVDRYLYGVMYAVEKKLAKDPYLKGIWYGNDTIWRTVIDLNYIQTYTDKKGILQNTPQRKILNFADMIIGGEHNGPCQPEPKKIGVVLAGESAAAMDLVICKMMGFPYKEIPLIRALLNHEADYLYSHAEEILIESNISEYNKLLQNAVFPERWNYRPHDAWADTLKKGRINNE